MSASESPGQKLKAGEHYGSNFHKYRLSSAIISESLYKKSLCLPEHSHELGFFTLILNGHYSEEINKRDVIYSPKTVLWRQAGIPHKDKIETVSSRFFFIEIDSACSEKLRQHGNIPDIFTEQNGSLTWLASRLRNEIVSGEAGSPLIAEGITLEMLGYLTRTNSSLDKKPPKWIVQVAERLNEEFAEPLTNEDLAMEAGVHPVHLAAAFRRFYNETIGEYVQRLRVDRASVLLQDPEIPLTEIAFSCGFADQSHFTRIFKRRVGVTPGAYRISVR
jgi:AraC family transcriptional regulator